MWHVWGRGEMHIGFWWGSLRGRGLLGRPRRRWDDNIRIDVKEIGWENVNWVDLV